MILPALAGAVAAALLVGFGNARGGIRLLPLYALGLVGAALVYVGFAAFSGGQERLPLEALGLSLYTLVAVLGARRWPALLAAGWAGHALWDLLLHPASGSAYVPGWYPAACAGFDVVVGAYLGWLLWRRTPAATRTAGAAR